jgi:hydroxymethylglutaryl-CoA reductase (NADPH)
MRKVDSPSEAPSVPRHAENDYTTAMAEKRRAFVREQTGAELVHVSHHSFEPSVVPGNIENFLGVAQVPIGLAGPLHVVGEHANGHFYIPMATTEGTLVASYNRGMRLLRECGGVRTAVVEHAMQRAPVFILHDAKEAREFGKWIVKHFAQLKKEAEATTSVGKLTDIGQYQVGPLRYLRFNYTTGDAAGQNLTGKATFHACEWIKKEWPGGIEYILSGGIDTDKKHSVINRLLTRGKRVVAEAVLRKELVKRVLGVDTSDLFRSRQIQQVGAFLAGAASTSSHPANGLAALFIATGQDAANVAESHASITYSQLLDNGDYYWSITLTSLIVATYGGGTGLPTQKECLQMMGCYGKGMADRFSEICAGVVLAGDLSLAGAVLAGDWVTSHDRLGRNRR